LQLKASVEGWEIQTEELRASNEELQAMNEELSSAAEELETRNEELQSVGEELTTVNQELKIKIDELLQTNNDIRNLINSTEMATVFVDRSLRIKLFTTRARDLFTLISTDVGRPLGDIRTQLVGTDLLANIEEVLDKLQSIEREVMTESGRTYVMKLAPYRTLEDSIEGVVMTFVDLTDRRAWHQQREQLLEGERAARITAEGATRLKDEFLTTLSHEMRTPLSVITSWSQLLENKFAHFDPQLRRGLSVIGNSAFSLAQFISDLLDMARMQTGKLMLDLAPLDVREIASGAVHSLRPDAERKNIKLTFSSEVDAAMVHGDRTRLQQVFWNLIANAIKFTPDKATIDVTLTPTSRDYEIAVRDSGAGMAPEFLPRVFQRFSQADGSSSRRHAGLGLGLAIVKELVELHGGSVAASSAGVGKGSTFVVHLPIWAPTLGAMDAFTDLAHDAAALQRVRVLVIDDSPELLESLTRELETCGAHPTGSGSSSDALALIERHPERFNVLVVDIGMPHVDGYEFIRRVRKDLGIAPERLPAIALTAFSRDEDRRRALASGFQAHVVKPYRVTDLVQTIASLVQGGVEGAAAPLTAAAALERRAKA
ncbi:MAG: ATP-binding protein, partial [Pseudomonadota bacterium]|nr:ATP-binding protein [Pseudomonadota bacterium]